MASSWSGCAMSLLDFSVEILLGEPFKRRLEGWSAGMWVDDGGIDYEGVSELESSEVGVERVADEDCARVEDINELLLDVF